MLMKQNKKVLFIQYRAFYVCQVWILEDGAMKRLTSPILNMASVVEDLVQTRQTKFDVCICDGLRMKEANCIYLWGALRALRRAPAMA